MDEQKKSSNKLSQEEMEEAFNLVSGMVKRGMIKRVPKHLLLHQSSRQNKKQNKSEENLGEKESNQKEEGQ